MKSKDVCVVTCPTMKSSGPFRVEAVLWDVYASPQFQPMPRALNVKSKAFNMAPLSWVEKSLGALGGSQENRSRTKSFDEVAKSVARSTKKDRNHCHAASIRSGRLCR